MRVSPEDYEALKTFFAIMIDEATTIRPDLPAEHHPLFVLGETEAKSMARARYGLALAIGDLLEESQYFPAERVTRIDRRLAEAGAPTLTETRLRFSTKVAAIMKRGRVGSEREFYLLKNVADAMPEGEREAAWAMLDGFEAAGAAPRAKGREGS